MVNVEEADDNWLAWMSSLGRLRRYIHEIEERGKYKIGEDMLNCVSGTVGGAIGVGAMA